MSRVRLDFTRPDPSLWTVFLCDLFGLRDPENDITLFGNDPDPFFSLTNQMRFKIHQNIVLK
jgi:hypothetical protein